MKRLSLACILVAATAPPASSQPNGADVWIGGSARVVGEAGAVSSITIGGGATASNSVGVIRRGASINGDANVYGSARSATAIAGPASSARTRVGVIEGAHVLGSATASGSVNSVTAVAPLPGTSVCAAIGSVGPGVYGSVSARGAASSVTVYDFGLARRTSVRIGTVGRPC